MQSHDLIQALQFVEFYFPESNVDLSGNSLIVNGARGKIDLRTGVVILKDELGSREVFQPGDGKLEESTA